MWQIYKLTGDPLMLGLIGLAEAIPAIIGSLFSGYIVDISTPHHVYKTCIGGLVLNLLFLLVVGGNFLSIPHTAVIPLLFLGIFVSGIARSFMMPAYFSITPQIVEKKDYAARQCVDKYRIPDFGHLRPYPCGTGLRILRRAFGMDFARVLYDSGVSVYHRRS